jgi:aldehyde:ferredoxin oxidoreductase
MWPPVFYMPDIPSILYSLTGVKYFNNPKNIYKSARKICLLRRAFNQREGLSRKDDTLPERLLKEPLPDGPAKGHVVNLEPMLDEYYKLYGIGKDGKILPKTLDEFGLKEVKKALYGK